MKIEIIGERETFPIVEHEDQRYCIAQKGKEYKIRVTNTTGQRVLAVVSVDGVNIVNGEDASKQGPGYVIDPFQTVTIPGWHRTSNEVAAFAFSDVGGGYAPKMGKGTSNVGVIGLAAFREMPTITWTQTVYYPQPLSHTLASPAHAMDFAMRSVYCSTAGDSPQNEATLNCMEEPSATLRQVNPAVTKCSTHTRSMSKEPPAKLQDTATAYGAKKDYRTETCAFNHEDTPFEVVTIRYATAKVLESWGVPIKQPTPPSPDAFPADKVNCTAPPGWNG